MLDCYFPGVRSRTSFFSTKLKKKKKKKKKKQQQQQKHAATCMVKPNEASKD